MIIDTQEYIIGGGKEGKSRLNTLSEVLEPNTRSLLEQQGLRAGKTMLDLGCGGGNVSIIAAQMVGDTGSVTGVDADESILALARKDAAGINNVSFTTMRADDMDYQAEFDFAYARFLLSHLEHPAEVLQKMAASVKPGGKIIVEDVQFSGHFCYPECDAFDWYIEHYTTLARNNGQNAEIGPQLFSMFRQAGIRNVGFDVIQPCFATGAGKWMAYLTLERIKGALVSHNRATISTIDTMLGELEAFTKDGQTIMSLPRIFRVWGEK